MPTSRTDGSPSVLILTASTGIMTASAARTDSTNQSGQPVFDPDGRAGEVELLLTGSGSDALLGLRVGAAVEVPVEQLLEQRLVGCRS